MLLASCGGGDSSDAASSDAAATAAALAAAGQQLAEPAYHIAPVLLDEPADTDVLDPRGSANSAPHRQTVSAELAGLETRRLTVQAIGEARRTRAYAATAPQATPAAVSVYTPAQIRAAYGLPDLPAPGASLTAEQAARLGAGQTIYIVDAMHDPNVVAELSAFNQRFGLPTCETRAIPAAASLPLAPASTGDGCVFSVVYSTPTAGMRSSAPAYNASWATEITLDVQWAHATAPLARIILIEAPDASSDGLVGAIKLANAMGPGAVSMSFGSAEGPWTSYFDSAFAAAGMSYLAATGDWGTGVMWPSASSYVLAVGGTRLSYSGSGARSETGWTSTGGGISAYIATPAYQAGGVPGSLQTVRRTVADVAFNADPASGQYVAVLTPGSSTPSWISAGGTSLSTPQWAGLVAIANALRARAGKDVLGAPHTAIYGYIGASASVYASAFADISSGANGSCATCSARVGFDTLTGMGTPHVASLLGALTDAGSSLPAVEPPVVTAGNIAATVGKALTFTVAASSRNALTFSASGAPAGMTITAATGAVSWPKPVLGSYAVTVTAKDGKTGLTGKGVYTVKVEPVPVAPVISAASVTGHVGSALSYTVLSKAGHAVTYSLGTAPSGLSIGSSSGTLAWANPVLGSYAVTVTGKDNDNGLSGQAVVTIRIEPALVPPTVAGGEFTGVAGKALSGKLAVTPSNAVTVTLSGAPAGLTVSAAGAVAWPKPVVGNYTVGVSVKDKKNGLSASATLRLHIAPAPVAPAVVTSPVSGMAGEPLRLSVGVTAEHVVSWSLRGAPVGMSINADGKLNWPSPVAGAYSVTVVALDQVNGLSGTAVYKISIAKKPVQPVITVAPISGKAGKALAATIAVKDPAGYALTISVADLPPGLLASMSSTGVTLKWTSPVTGVYTLIVKATNSAGLSVGARITVNIAAK